MRAGLLDSQIEDFLKMLQDVSSKGEGKWQAICPACGAAAWHFSIIDYGDGIPHCHCVKCGASTNKIIEILCSEGYKPIVIESEHKDHGRLIEKIKYYYYDSFGQIQYMKHRRKFEDGHKFFFFTHLELQGDKMQEVKGKPENAVGLYRHEYLKRAIELGWDKPLYIVEGEKCADAMIKHGYLATSGNTGSKSKLTLQDIAVLQKFRCRIIPDNDAPGLEYVKVFQNVGIRDLLVIPMTEIWPECPTKGDMADYFEWKEVQDGT